ncbi:hypothetical protein Taro_026948, partial [Colocasia esculenta]|nr:hypothetical protein [Colocasia esculenta]
VWGTPGCSIPAVGFPADVATTDCIVTSEKASPRSDVTLSRCVLLSRPASPSQQGLVAVGLTVAMVSRWLRRVRQDLVCLGCFRGHGWRVGVCPRAECAHRTFEWERGRLPPCIQ